MEGEKRMEKFSSGEENPVTGKTGRELFHDLTEINFSRKSDTRGVPYVGCDISESDVESYLTELKNHLGEDAYTTYVNNQKKRDASEYHITLIGPQELGEFSEEKLAAALEQYGPITGSDMKKLGVGSVSDDLGNNTTYYVVVESEKLQHIRQALGLNKRDFHITIGFDTNDVFGKPKDKSTLIG